MVTDDGLVDAFPAPFDVFPIPPAVPAQPEENTVTPATAVAHAAPTVPGVDALLCTAFPPAQPLLEIVPLFVRVHCTKILYPAGLIVTPTLTVMLLQ